ncbi:seven-hairpin glycosidase [Cyathus striatus]|nr:seven-hairpin glycosidase [Cyathus striatus]
MDPPPDSHRPRLWLFSPFLLPYRPPPLQVYGPHTHPPIEGSSNHPRPYHPSRPIGPHTKWSERADAVRNSFIHAWENYQTYAAGYDEVLPVSGGKVNNFNGWGVTLFDSIDTMWIMGLHDIFHDSLEVVAKSTFVLDQGSFAPFFETIIRYLGGLLSAYALSAEPVLLSRADDLGKMLLPAFNTTSGLPSFAVNTVSGETRQGWSGSVLWAEALSNQMEYKYLAHLTGRTEYYNKSEHIMQMMYTADLPDAGQFPTMWDIINGEPSNHQFSVGAFADSAHEYLLKQWLLTGQSEPKARELYLKAVDAVLSNLLYITPNRQLLYVTDTIRKNPTHRFEHLSCFFSGLLALGIHTMPELSLRDIELHSWAAQGLAETCWITYADTKTGLGPDVMQMSHSYGPSSDDSSPQATGKWLDAITAWENGGRQGNAPGTTEVQREPDAGKRDYYALKGSYLLRPETVESFYLLWRTTGEERWRERGWAVFESIEKHTRTKYGYASLSLVDKLPAEQKDEMPSYFLAETLKYLYLLFTDEEIIPLKDWVFNTEAHPFPVFNWSPWEKKEYNIFL